MINPTDIDWTELVKQVDAAEPQEGWGWDGAPAKMVFLGMIPDSSWDSIDWWDATAKEATKYGLFITTGMNPYDVYVGKFVEV